MRIAIVHDYFTQLGGAEKVVEELVRMLPQADLHATVALPDRMSPGLKGKRVVTSWMQHLPWMVRYYRLYFLFYPFAVASLDLSKYDLIISSSSGYAKGVRTRNDALHICYCHSPMRWVWSFDSYSVREPLSKATRALLLVFVRILRLWDVSASRQPDHFIANSQAVAARILGAYGRHAEIIHPPIDLDRFRPAKEVGDYYLVLARLVSYKRIDLAVQACSSLGKQLFVIGEGPDRTRLETFAGPTIRFLGRLPDKDVEGYVARCRALIFPGEEDFGIAPLEVAAAGRPTIAYRAGGAIETIVDGTTGIFFEQQEPEALAAAIQDFEQREWCPRTLRKHAERFSVDSFQRRFKAFLELVGTPVEDVA